MMPTTSICFRPDAAAPAFIPSIRPRPHLIQDGRTIPPSPRRRTTPQSQSRHAFARVEAVALVFIALVMLALLLATAPNARRQSMLNRDLANLRQIGAWTFAYANDFKDLHPSLSSAPNTIWPKLRPSGDPLRDAAGQAIDIIRRRTGRVTFPLPLRWIPHVRYTHLVLADYAQRHLPDTTFVSTGDKHRLNWLDDPINKHDQEFWQPFQNPESGSVMSIMFRWPYSSSYQTPPALYDEGQSKWGAPRAALSQSTNRSYSVPTGVVLGGIDMTIISFPAQKVLLHDYGSWYTSRQAQYYAVESAAPNVLMSDGSAAMRSTGDANPGWNPGWPASPNATLFFYSPRRWEPPTSDGTSSERVSGYYRWTRGGIKGRDFDGPEINTGQY